MADVGGSDPIAGKKPATLSRFIDKRHFSIQKFRPKPGAFLPSSDLKTSAFKIDGLREDEIWWIADNIVARESQRAPAPARADILSTVVLDARLSIEPEPEFHPRHINICGWPREKEQQKAIDLDLCAAALLRVR